jgi:thiol:disulfide interchange protein
VRCSLNLAIALTILGAAFHVHAAHTQVRLVLAAEQARTGDTVMAAVHLKMDPGWHTYWKNSGQSGIPTAIEWQLPPGVSVGDIQWSIPQKITEKTGDVELTTYAFEQEAVLVAPLNLASSLKSGSINLKAEVTWLECGEGKCVPGSASVEATFRVGAETIPSKDAESMLSWQKKLPENGAKLSPRASWENPGTDDARPLILEWNAAAPAVEADFYPYNNENLEVEPATEKMSSEPGKARLRVRVKKAAKQWPKEVSGVIVQGMGSERKGYEVKVLVAETSGPGPASSPVAATASAAGTAAPTPPLWKMLLFAFVGGLILNIMPCVLPVISLKILGFVREAQNETARVRRLGLVYTAGVLSSFLALGIIILGLQFAGQQVGWGFQFSSPYFLIAMATLITLVTLNLFGVFEVTLNSNTLTAANTLASKEGAAGTFFNGLLATILATSCSAPIFAPAIGFALTLKSPFITLLVLLTAGVGLAAPYLLLSWQPKWLKLLPKPGPWMQRFKVAMGFPMLAAAIWLCSLVAAHYGERGWWAAMFLVFVAVAAWVFGEFAQRGLKHRAIALLISASLLVAGYAFALENRLEWRHPIGDGDRKAQAAHAGPKGLPWMPYSPAGVAAAQAAGHPVVVDFTATWCPNCNIIVKPSLENASVQKKLKEIGAVLLVADYSLSSKRLVSDLAPFNRAAIPVVLVYSPTTGEQPQVFDAVTPGTLLDALSRAAPQASLPATSGLSVAGEAAK